MLDIVKIILKKSIILVGNQNRILLHNGDNITENTILFVEKETNFAIEELIDGELLISFDIKNYRKSSNVIKETIGECAYDGRRKQECF